MSGGGLVTKSYLTFVTLRTITHQAPLSMGFFWQEYWSRMPFPPPRDLLDPRTEPISPGLWHRRGFFITEPPGKPNQDKRPFQIYIFSSIQAWSKRLKCLDFS